jgi:hypothetical protein
VADGAPGLMLGAPEHADRRRASAEGDDRPLARPRGHRRGRRVRLRGRRRLAQRPAARPLPRLLAIRRHR